MLVESIALVSHRLGATALRVLLDAFLPALSVVDVDEPLHSAGITALRAAVTGKPSFVDRVSFELMPREGIRHAFAFDADFHREGFELVPG